jgi:hypothetical protein
MALRDLIYKLHQKRASDMGQSIPQGEGVNPAEQQATNQALQAKHEELKAGADQVAEEAMALMEDSGLPPSFDQVFEKRRTAAKMRYIASLEKAYSTMLQGQSTQSKSLEEAIARFEILAASAEANFISELQGLIAEELEVRAKMDLDTVKQQQKDDRAAQLDQQKAESEQQKLMAQQQAAQAMPYPSLGGVQSQGSNPLAPPMQ